MKQIQTIDLASNRLTSIDLTSLAQTDLHLLRLQENQIKGFLDFAPLSNASNLKTLELNDNENLDGNVFAHLTNWTKLESLNLAETLFGGTLPQDIGKLTNLQTLNLESPFLSPLPTSIGNCQSITNIRVVAPAGVKAGLTGGLPTEMGLLTNLRGLEIRDNRELGSTLPTELGQLTKLVEVFLPGDELTGTLPTELGNLDQLENFWLNGNPISGTVPTEYGRMTSLQLVNLVGTDINGTMADEVCDLNTVIEASCRKVGDTTYGRLDCDCCMCYI